MGAHTNPSSLNCALFQSNNLLSAVLYLTISDLRIEDHILVTDIGHATDDALVCWYRSSFTQNKFDWHHNSNGEQGLGTEIHKNNDSRNAGWSIMYTVSNRLHKLSLMRKSSTHVKVGILSCQAGTIVERCFCRDPLSQ